MESSDTYYHLYQKYKRRYLSQLAGAKGAKGANGTIGGCGLNTNNPSGRRTCVRLGGRVAKQWKITESSPDCEAVGNRCRLRETSRKRETARKTPEAKRQVAKQPRTRKAVATSKYRNAEFHDLAGDIFGEKDYEEHGYITHGMVDAADGAHGGDAVKAYLRQHSDEIHPGDIIYVGSTSESDPELGFGIVLDATTGTWADTDEMPPVDLPFRTRGSGIPEDVLPMLQREGVKYHSLFDQLGDRDSQGEFVHYLGFPFLENVEQKPSGEWTVVDRYRVAGIWD